VLRLEPVALPVLPLSLPLPFRHVEWPKINITVVEQNKITKKNIPVARDVLHLEPMLWHPANATVDVAAAAAVQVAVEVVLAVVVAIIGCRGG
jgi:hypothetical protein